MDIGQIRPGTNLIIEGEIYQVVVYEHVKLARGPAFCRAKMKSLKGDKLIERTLRDSDDVKEAFIEKRKVQFLYKDSSFYHFMDLLTYEGLRLDESSIFEIALWLKENVELEGLFHDGNLINLGLPDVLELKIIETEPGFRGDTVKQGTKPAKLETGATIQVPLFLNNDTVIRVDPKTKQYLSKA